MTTRLSRALARIAADLDDLGASWAVVGGLAVSARAEPRTTRDVDIAIATASDAAAERVVFELRQRGYEVTTSVEHWKLKRLATVRLLPPETASTGPVVDLLFCSSGIEVETVRDAELIEILSGVVAPVALVPHLCAMKLLARDDRRRPQDLDDLHALLDVASDSDVGVVRDLLHTMVARESNRARDLVAALDELLEERRQR